MDIADAERMAIGIADGNGLAEVFFQVDEADLPSRCWFKPLKCFIREKGNTLSLGQSEQFLKAAETGKGVAHLQPEVIRPTVPSSDKLEPAGGSPVVKATC